MSERTKMATVKAYVRSTKDGSLVDVEALSQEQQKQLETFIKVQWKAALAAQKLWNNTKGLMVDALKRGEG
ncbi:hypothetical protein ACTQ33_15950 [Candidatus Avoscillospira sp. LCP25S3_F1]|uniref:hypothetical protein n=1 Tax=Candidatus Avoscillospira sp. LCP25S3_F1 TaxID=3438825 RepID=UPI003F93A3A9